jgi:hydrogenase small subunit
MGTSLSDPTTYEVLRDHGVDRRTFLKFCTGMTAMMGLEATFVPNVVKALESKPRLPVLWLEGLSCTCCTESFIRSSHPLVSDVILNMISLDYNETIQAAAGFQAEEIVAETIQKKPGGYLVAVEGNAPVNDGGVYCTIGGETFLEKLKRTAAGAKAVVAWGNCATFGCVQAASPNPTGATPVSQIITDKPVINVSGCPPIPIVMTGVLTYILTFDRLPELDRYGRPKMFYLQRIHDKCYRRAFFDAGQYVTAWDDEGARLGHCLYKMGCRGPTTYNYCSTFKWNDGVSWPIGSGHGCIGCSEQGFWDNGPFYERLANIPQIGIDAWPQKVGVAVAGAALVAAGAHAVSAIAKNAVKPGTREPVVTDNDTQDRG